MSHNELSSQATRDSIERSIAHRSSLIAAELADWIPELYAHGVGYSSFHWLKVV
jgi:hypothetical protein